MNTRAVIRYSLGSSLIASIAFVYAWPLSYLLPVLALGFFAPEKKAPKLKEGLMFIMTVAVASMVGLLVGSVHTIPLILIMFIGLILLHIFYSAHPVMNPLVKTWMIIAIIILPLMNILLPGLSVFVAVTLVVGAAGSILMVWLIFSLFPDKNVEDDSGKKPDTINSPEAPSASERLDSALTSTLIVLPMLVLFYVFELTDWLLVLIFIGIFSMQANLVSWKMGKALIFGNFMGGLIAIIVFNLLSVAPYLDFLAVLVTLVALICGSQFFSGKATSPLYNMAFSAFILIIGSTLSDVEGDPSKALWSRIIGMSIAVTYVVVAYQMIRKWKEFRSFKKKLTPTL